MFHEGHDVFRELATEITRVLLDIHPRPAAEIAIEAEPYVMPSYEPEAYNQLVEAGMTVEVKDHIWGETAETRPLTPIPATSSTIEHSLTLFPYTHKAVVVDENGRYLLNYYESGGSYRLWLPDSHIDRFKDRLKQNASAAIRREDYWKDETDS